jgi:protein-S-isoprenylcysteine O-methyltransferase Ste14
VFHISRRRFADFLLFGVTAVELAIVVTLTPTFTVLDWIYVLEHTVVLGIALTRGAARAQDHSLLTSAVVLISYGYGYAQVIYLGWVAGDSVWPSGGLVMVTFSAGLSFTSLVTLGKSFGVRPALRDLVTTGPYRVVRHPIYLSYMISDIGYNLQEWNFGTIALVMMGWICLVYRIQAEERVLSNDGGWHNYTVHVRYRLLPGIW